MNAGNIFQWFILKQIPESIKRETNLSKEFMSQLLIFNMTLGISDDDYNQFHDFPTFNLEK